MIVSDNDFFFMRVKARFYYGRVIRIVEDGALCQILNGNFHVLIGRDDKRGDKIKMPHTGETGEIEMIRPATALPFRQLDSCAALSWYVTRGRKNEITV